MKNYRPDNWGDIKKSIVVHTQSKMGQIIIYDDVTDQILEAGADAILEALKTSEIHSYVNEKDVTRLSFPVGSFCRGWVVFIPEETKK